MENRVEVNFDLNQVEAVILDMDGTMVDTLDDFVIALNQMLGDLALPQPGCTIDRATVARLVGKGSEHLIKQVLIHVSQLPASVDLDAKALAQLCELAWPSYQRHYLAVNGLHAQVYPGVLDGLTQLKARGLPLACLTNKPIAFALPLLKAKGLDRFFDFTFGGDSFDRKKPDPLPLLKTCEALGTAPHRTLMIGDSSNDAQAARAAGCPVLLVSYGYNHGVPIRTVDADGYMDSLQHLIPS